MPRVGRPRARRGVARSRPRGGGASPALLGVHLLLRGHRTRRAGM